MGVPLWTLDKRSKPFTGKDGTGWKGSGFERCRCISGSCSAKLPRKLPDGSFVLRCGNASRDVTLSEAMACNGTNPFAPAKGQNAVAAASPLAQAA